MKTDIYTETPPSSPSLSSGTSLLQAVPNTKKTERKRKRLSDYLPLPLILPGSLVSLLLFRISQAQTTHATPLFQEDFHWANNAWNSNKTAISPIESLHFEGKAYMSRRCVKIASSSQTGSIHTRITEIPPGRIQLIVRGARYDKAKESRRIRLNRYFLLGKHDIRKNRRTGYRHSSRCQRPDFPRPLRLIRMPDGKPSSNSLGTGILGIGRYSRPMGFRNNPTA